MDAQPTIGDDVRVVYHDRDNGNMPTTAHGRMGVETDDAGRVTAIVLEGDGSATRVPRGDIFSVSAD